MMNHIQGTNPFQTTMILMHDLSKTRFACWWLNCHDVNDLLYVTFIIIEISWLNFNFACIVDLSVSMFHLYKVPRKTSLDQAFPRLSTRLKLRRWIVGLEDHNCLQNNLFFFFFKMWGPPILKLLKMYEDFF